MTDELDQLARDVDAALAAGSGVEAVRLFKAILEIDPEHFQSAMWLAKLLREQGETAEAVSYAELAARLRPEDVDALLSLGFSYVVNWQPRLAVAVLQRASELAPDSAEAHFYLGFALEQTFQFEGAAGEIEMAIELNPTKLEAYVTLGSIQRKLGENGAARLTLRRALQLVAGSFEGNLQLGQTFIDAGILEHGLDCLKRASAINPSAASPYEAKGKALLQVGRFSEAASFLEQSIALNPKQAEAYMRLTYCRKTTEAHRPLLRQMESLVNEGKSSERDRAALDYGLGRGYDELGEYETAMARFDAANQDARNHLMNASDKRERYRARVDWICKTFTSEFLASNASVGSEDATPVFIVGMIRSGTTLVEQIVSSHPDVAPGGELACMVQRSKSVVPEGTTELNSKAASELIQDYLTVLRGLDHTAARVTDKAPHNYVMLGVIHLLFPNARIIACRRNPVDNCLSAYMTPFASLGDFAHDKADIAFLYEQHVRLMNHWSTVLPPARLLEVSYEGLVSHQETVARQMIDFLGVTWNDACLRHERNERRITTPSAWQARQKIYTTAVDRWRHYEPWLGPFTYLA